MKDNLQDLIQHTHGLGIINLIKIVGTDKETLVSAVSEDKTVIVSGKTNDVITEFSGTFGMPNLSKLKTILSFDDYDENAIITVEKKNEDGVDYPESIHFETKNGDFVNEYRFMSKSVVEGQVRNVTFKGVTWNIEFKPSVAGIMRFKKQVSAHSEELNFTLKTDNGDLKIYFGDHSTHSGNFVFQSGIKGTLSKKWMWPVKVFQAILDLPGDMTVRISDQGAAEVIVDSGLATYSYLIPAQAK